MRIIAIILGLLFGSLGSVLLLRLGEKIDKETIKGILRGRSQCPNCGTTLKARNLIPLVSFLIQKGKCEHCKHPISSLYPILEIGSAIVFFVSFLAFQHAGIGIIIFWCVVNRLFFLLIVYDIMKYELHVPLWTILAVIIAVPQFFGIGNYLYAAAGLGFFLLIFFLIFRGAKYYVKKKYGMNQEGFGEGDIYLAGVIGLLVPFIFKQHYLIFGRNSLLSIFILFIILSCSFGILFRFFVHIIKAWKPDILRHTTSPIFHGRVLIPFIPAMIVAFWLLLRKGDFFISFLLPLG